MNRRRMVAVPRAWDTLELMSLEYVTRDFGGAFFLAPRRSFSRFVFSFFAVLSEHLRQNQVSPLSDV